MEAATVPRFDPTDFGHAMRTVHFSLDPTWTFVNHGAFGAPCTFGMAAAAAWRSHAERQPLKFIDRELFAHLVESTRSVAEWIGATPSELVLLPNATAGLNAVISSIVCTLNAGDEVLLFDVGYGSVRSMVERACRQSGAVPVVIALADALPASHTHISERFQAALTARSRLAIFDDITSNTALAMPVDVLCTVCRERGVLSLVDAAHSLGSRPSSHLPWLQQADFAAGNLHKWVCGPRGSGFLFAREEMQPLLEPPLVSHGYGAGFASSFIWSGANDYSAILVAPALVHRWWGEAGVSRSVSYQQALLSEAVALLESAWGTSALVPASEGFHMALIQLPRGLGDAPVGGAWTGKAVQDALHFEYSVECPVKTVSGRLYARISAAMYNERADYERLASAVSAIAGTTRHVT